MRNIAAGLLAPSLGSVEVSGQALEGINSRAGYQGVKEVSPVVLAHARMLGASRQQLRTVYLPSATSWVFSSLHTSVGLAFVGAVVGEYQRRDREALRLKAAPFFRPGRSGRTLFRICSLCPTYANSAFSYIRFMC